MEDVDEEVVLLAERVRIRLGGGRSIDLAETIVESLQIALSLRGRRGSLCNRAKIMSSARA